MPEKQFSGTKNFTYIKDKNCKARKPQVKDKSMKMDKYTL